MTNNKWSGVNPVKLSARLVIQPCLENDGRYLSRDESAVLQRRRQGNTAVQHNHIQVKEERQTKKWMGGISSSDFEFFRVALWEIALEKPCSSFPPPSHSNV